MPYVTTGYHTCLDKGGPAYIRQHAPFLATKDPFLSLGYYFWEYRESDAHVWGQNRGRYPRGYVICQCQLELSYLLDLDYPPDLDELANLEREMRECARIPVELPIGQLIQWFRDLDDPDIFPYDSVRTRQEPPRYVRQQRQYAGSQPHQLLTWNPQFIICTFSKNATIVTSCIISYPEHYRQRVR